MSTTVGGHQRGAEGLVPYQRRADLAVVAQDVRRLQFEVCWRIVFETVTARHSRNDVNPLLRILITRRVTLFFCLNTTLCGGSSHQHAGHKRLNVLPLSPQV